MEALRPFITSNPIQDPTPKKYLYHSDQYTFDIELNVYLKRLFLFN
jgi:hypothetical protein